MKFNSELGVIAAKIIVVSVVGCFVILAHELDSLNFGMGCRAYWSVWWEERALFLCEACSTTGTGLDT